MLTSSWDAFTSSWRTWNAGSGNIYGKFLIVATQPRQGEVPCGRSNRHQQGPSWISSPSQFQASKWWHRSVRKSPGGARCLCETGVVSGTWSAPTQAVMMGWPANSVGWKYNCRPMGKGNLQLTRPSDNGGRAKRGRIGWFIDWEIDWWNWDYVYACMVLINCGRVLELINQPTSSTGKFGN